MLCFNSMEVLGRWVSFPWTGYSFLSQHTTLIGTYICKHKQSLWPLDRLGNCSFQFTIAYHDDCRFEFQYWCLRRFLGIIGRYLSESKLNQLHVDNFQIFFIEFGYMFYGFLWNDWYFFSKILNFECFISKSSGLYVTSSHSPLSLFKFEVEMQDIIRCHIDR